MAEFNRVQPFLFLTIFNVNYFLYLNKKLYICNKNKYIVNN